jgi:hypothetical protein
VLDEGRQRRRGRLPRVLERAFAEPVMQHAAWRSGELAAVWASRFSNRRRGIHAAIAVGKRRA